MEKKKRGRPCKEKIQVKEFSKSHKESEYEVEEEDGIYYSSRSESLKGNKNAVYWTKWRSYRLAIEMMKWMRASEFNVFYEEFYIDYAYQREKFLNNQRKEDGKESIRRMKGKHMRRITRDVIHKLKKKFPLFATLIKRMDDLKEQRLNSLGFRGKSNPAVTIFLLKAKYGYSDKTEPERPPIEMNIKHAIFEDLNTNENE